MVEQGGQDGLDLSVFGALQPSEGESEEFVYKPHSELLETAFQALKSAYQAGDIDVYRKIEAEFVRKFTLFWRFRVQKYEEAMSGIKPSYGNRYFIKIGENHETIGIRKEVHDDEFTLDIYREESSDAWENVHLNGHLIDGNLFTRVHHETVRMNQRYPFPKFFNLDLIDGKINSFSRTTIHEYQDESGRLKAISYQESVAITNPSNVSMGYNRDMF